MKTRMRRRWPWLVAALVMILAGAFVLWALTGPGALPEARAAEASDGRVTVEAGRWLAFGPTDATPTVRLVLYPGGRVDARAYAPLAREIAAAGYRVVIVPMPLRLAVLGPDRASEAMADHPEVTRWALGGYSLGGSMAARFAYRYPDAVAGLVLWAAYPAESDSLAGRILLVTSIYGTRDGLATPDKIEAARPLLPPSTLYVPIEGGNHAGFGQYGPQSGDLEATISGEEQRAQIVNATVALLDSLARQDD
jgi:hypothetical protein